MSRIPQIEPQGKNLKQIYQCSVCGGVGHLGQFCRVLGTALLLSLQSNETVAAILKYRRLNPRARHLAKSPGDAGYDLASAENIVVPARGTASIPTGLIVEVPQNTYGRIAPRSGLAKNHNLDVGAGVIDSGYRGEVQVILFNHSNLDYHVQVGDRIAQLLIIKLEQVIAIEGESIFTTDRDKSGFGSSGY